MYLMYGEYGIVKQQGEHHQIFPVVDDNSIRKYTFLEAMILVPQQKTRLISVPYSPPVSLQYITIFYIKPRARYFTYGPQKC